MPLLPTPIPILNTADFPASGGATTISLSSRCSYGSVYVSRLAFTPSVSMPTTASDVARSVATGMQFTEIDVVAGTTVNSAVSYTHLRAHETPEHLVCRLLLEKKKNKQQQIIAQSIPI
eukprot:TRINITY_DN33290_c0_g1_i1.p1 TRINITY_DN33290_c0_g1~~TRINITY_DN33290_c0_g1_i1.p1  ORF type:complete len:119 (-),score=19.94 TRINITY_DN33290_c0_g1_i1:39-395(-)